VPQWPTGSPARLVVRVEPFPLTAIRALSLQLTLERALAEFAARASVAPTTR
jgi:hypothetical protein